MKNVILTAILMCGTSMAYANNYVNTYTVCESENADNGYRLLFSQDMKKVDVEVGQFDGYRKLATLFCQSETGRTRYPDQLNRTVCVDTRQTNGGYQARLTTGGFAGIKQAVLYKKGPRGNETVAEMPCRFVRH